MGSTPGRWRRRSPDWLLRLRTIPASPPQLPRTGLGDLPRQRRRCAGIAALQSERARGRAPPGGPRPEPVDACDGRFGDEITREPLVEVVRVPAAVIDEPLVRE